MTCSLCGQEILVGQKFHRQVVGWERPGKGVKGHSGSSLVLRRQTGAVAHSECVTKMQSGIDPAQHALF